MTNTPFNSKGSFNLGNAIQLKFASNSYIDENVLVLTKDVTGKYYLKPKALIPSTIDYTDEMVIGSGNSYFYKSTFIKTTSSNEYTTLKSYVIPISESAGKRKKLYVTIDLDLYGKSSNGTDMNFYNFTTGYNIASSVQVDSFVSNFAAAAPNCANYVGYDYWKCKADATCWNGGVPCITKDCSRDCTSTPCDARTGVISTKSSVLADNLLAPRAMVVANGKLYVAGADATGFSGSAGKPMVDVIDLSTQKIIARLVGNGTFGLTSLAFCPTNNYVYGIGATSNIIINSINNTTVTTSNNFIGNAFGTKIVYNSTNSKLYVINGTSFTTYDTLSNYTMQSLTHGYINNFNNILHIPANATGNTTDKVILTGIGFNGGTRYLSYVPSNQTASTITTGANSLYENFGGGIVYHPSTNKIFVTSGNNVSSVAVFSNSAVLPTLSATIAVNSSFCKNASGIAYCTATDKLYVTDSISGLVAAGNLTRISIIDPLPATPTVSSSYISINNYNSFSILWDSVTSLLYATGETMFSVTPVNQVVFAINATTNAINAYPSQCTLDITTADGCCNNTSYNCVSGSCQQIAGTGGTYTTPQACAAVCGTTYNCVGTSCNSITGQSGTYATIKLCQDFCSRTYNCVSGSCQPIVGTGGLYTTYNNCYDNCGTTYNCIAGTVLNPRGTCAPIVGPNGTYASEGLCKSLCGESYNCVSSSCLKITGNTGLYETNNNCLDNCGETYNCVSGQCQKQTNSRGTFSSQSICEQRCGSSYNCISGECQSQVGIGGTYINETICNNSCGYSYNCTTLPSGLKSCISQIGHNGTYASEIICKAACGTSYNCISDSCQETVGLNGTYVNQFSCQNGCGFSYNCVGEFCEKITGIFGAYASEEACKTICNPPMRYECVISGNDSCPDSRECVELISGTFETYADCDSACAMEEDVVNTSSEIGSLNNNPPWTNDLPVDLRSFNFEYTHIPGSFTIIANTDFYGNYVPVMFGYENRHQYYEDILNIKKSQQSTTNQYANNILILQPNYSSLSNPLLNNFNIKDYPRVITHINSNGDLVLTIEAKRLQYTNETINWFCKSEIFVSIT